MRSPVRELEAKSHRLAVIYLVAIGVLIAISALRSPSVSQWLIRSVFAFLMGIVSLRYALVWLYRGQHSKLSWLVAPSPTEHEFTVMWLVYACFLAAVAIVIALI